MVLAHKWQIASLESFQHIFGFSFKSALGRINKHKKGLAAEIAWHMTWSQGTVQDQTLISKETSWHIKHIIHNNKMVDCWGVSGQNVANSSQNKALPAPRLRLGGFPSTVKPLEPGCWLTNTSHSSVGRRSRTKHWFFFSCLWFWLQSLF